MINGFEYAWEDIQIAMTGFNKPLDGVVEIKYGTEKNHGEIYGRGDEPVAMSRGGKKHTASITVLQSLHEAVQASMGKGKDVTNKPPFVITCAYAPEGGKATTDQLTFVRIKKFEKGMKTEDGNMTIVWELAVGKTNYNI